MRQKFGPSQRMYRQMMQQAHEAATPAPQPFIDFEPQSRPMLINGGGDYFPRGRPPSSFINRQTVDGYAKPYPLTCKKLNAPSGQYHKTQDNKVKRGQCVRSTHLTPEKKPRINQAFGSTI